MKKIFLTLSLIAFAMTANAQWILGGQLGFNTDGGKVNGEATTLTPAYDYPNNKTTNFTIAPTISYVLNEKMQIGLSLNYGLTKTTNYNPLTYVAGYEEYAITKNSSWGIAPYFRYYFAKAGKFNFFCEATLGFYGVPRTYNHNYSNVPVVGYDNEIDGATSASLIGFTLTPGVNYRLGQHWSADCYINLASLAFVHMTTKSYTGDNLDETNNYNYFGLEANASSQDLNTHFGNFSIGINYHF